MPDLNEYTLSMFAEHAAGPVLFAPETKDRVELLEARLLTLAIERWPELRGKPNCVVGDRIVRWIMEQVSLPKTKAGQMPVAEVTERLATRTTAAEGGTDGPEPRIPPRAQKAHEQYKQAVETMRDSNSSPSDREVYDKLALAYEQSGETDELPSFDTWRRNLSEYRKLTNTQKKKPRAGRGQKARSMVKYTDIEQEHLPSSVSPRR